MAAPPCVLLAILLQLTASARAAANGLPVRYSNSFAVELHDGASAEDIAARYDFVNLGQVGNLRNVYHFQLPSSAHAARNSVKTLRSGSLAEMDHAPELVGGLEQENDVLFVEQQIIKAHVKKGYYTAPTDPMWLDQWSLANTGQTSGPAGLDLRVEAAWMQNVTGRGVVVAIADNGLEITHPDLSSNYDGRASYDFIHNDADPTPDRSNDEENAHGTSCAGEVAMAKDNGNCGVGVAYNSNVGGLKFDLSYSTDIAEASLLGYNTDYIQVYSNSWGPVDNGFHVNGPGTWLTRALQTGVSEGRGGKGSIYVWAAGNGGNNYDSCAADGYSSSIYTIAVGSADQTGAQAFYDEQCSGKMAVTFSYNSETFGTHPYGQIVTTALNGECTDGFTGTSASAPLMSGVVALTLQANPELTWRDVKYLIAYTSNPELLIGGEWTTNGAGLNVSHKFGFGAVDAEAMVTRARSWTTVPPLESQTIIGSSSSGTARMNAKLTVTFNVQESSAISFLEHVVVEMSIIIRGYSQNFDYSDYETEYDSVYYLQDLYDWLASQHTRRGDVKIALVSPSGTKSILLPYRKFDFINEEGYDNWPFMSVHHWGENPLGQWTLRVFFKSSSGNAAVSGIKLKLYGTSATPQAVQEIPSQCDPACARGCSGRGPEHCDACRELRVAQTLECVSTCPHGTELYKNYCLGEVGISTIQPQTFTSSTAQPPTVTSSTTPTLTAASPSQTESPTIPTSTTSTSKSTTGTPNATTSDSTIEPPTNSTKSTMTASVNKPTTQQPPISTSQTLNQSNSSGTEQPVSSHHTLNVGAVIAGSIVGGAVLIVALTLLAGALLYLHRRKMHPSTQGFSFVPLSDTGENIQTTNSCTNSHTDV